ncbi:aldehyde dehydrogenase family protein [Azovibrio restrictus]|uniref:aldehyde dehydrogenase family protein n=1 Tax=Azovibrio restrictus TaxID=146938 RepID=UPI0026ED3B29|nr:aldehyde dehydrogenase family protein [Azovibrio restrictus]
MMLSPDGPPALPLWINGRAFLTMAPAFYEVCDAQTGAALRRTPLCGAEEVAEAARAARAAAPAWAARESSARQELLQAWAAGLEQYTGHFAKLVRQETGKDEAQALAEVEAALAALGAGIGLPEDAGQVVGLAWDDTAPLARAASLLAPILRAGGTVVLKPSPRTPGAVYALVELSARVGLPAGVVNLVQGDEAALQALFAEPEISRVAFSGRDELVARVAVMAAQGGKPFSVED